MPKDLTGVDVVFYGHSHKYSAKVVDGVLWLNPGSCGKQRFGLEITMCCMTVDNGRCQFENFVSAEPELKVEVTWLRGKSGYRH